MLAIYLLPMTKNYSGLMFGLLLQLRLSIIHSLRHFFATREISDEIITNNLHRIISHKIGQVPKQYRH